MFLFALFLSQRACPLWTLGTFPRKSESQQKRFATTPETESTMFHASRDLAIDQIHTALDRLEATRTWTSAPPAQTVASLVGTAPIVCALDMITVDGLNKAQQFQGRPTDVFLSTFPKTGTTWLQQICHQLRTGNHQSLVATAIFSCTGGH